MYSQYFKVDTIRFESPENKMAFYDPENNFFPEIVSEKHWAVSNYINQYLHIDFLHIMPHTKGNPFEAVSPAKGEISGTSNIEFAIENNTSRIFSVTLSAEYTAAYSEFFSLNYNFNAQTGEYITLTDLFSIASLEKIQKKLAALRIEEINEFLLSIDTNSKSGKEQKLLYTQCLPYIKESSAIYERFILTDTTVTFIHERCSNHALRALDDLDEYYTSLSITSLKNELTPFGLNLFYGKASKAKSNPVYPAMKLMKGKIGKNLNVTFIMGSEYSNTNNVSGMYFYDNYGTLIEISATIENENWSIIEYSGPNVKNAHMSGQYKNGVFNGLWTHDSDGRKLPITIKLIHK